MKKINKWLLLALLLPAVFTIVSCKDRKCIKCESDFNGIKDSYEECYASGKEAQQNMDAWTSSCMSAGKGMSGTYKCNCSRVESL